MGELIDQFSFFLINDDDAQLGFDLSKKLQTSVIILDKYDYLSFICVDDKLILINDSYVIKILPLLYSNNKSTIYSLSSDVNPLFLCENSLNNLKCDRVLYLEENIIYKKEIESFSSQLEIKNKDIQQIWKIIRRIISAYLIQKSYIDSFFDRMKNYKELMNSQPKEKTIERDKIIHLRNIYTTNTSKIELIYFIPQKRLFVIKNIMKENNLFEREKNNYLQCQHPFIPRYIGNDSENYLVIEYIQGTTLNFINNIQLEMHEKIKIVFELMIVFQYIHQKNFIYRDLKPNNLIIDNNKNIVLIDFDRMISNSYVNNGLDSTRDFTDFGAPEFSSNSSNISFKVDIYSIGKIIDFIFFKNQKQTEYNEEYSILKEVCELCMNIDPEKRPNISELIDFFYDKMHPYLFQKMQENDLFYNDLCAILENSYQKALNNFGMFHLYWMKSDLSHQKGIQFLHIAAELNCCEAQYNLGFIYYEAKFTQRNVNKAIKYLILAANQNLPIAQFVLSVLYYEGKYIESDVNKSVYYLKMALDNNYVDALYAIGSYYPYDSKLISCFDKEIQFASAVSGNVNATFSKKGLFKSMKYFKLAADQNDVNSQYMLGIRYYNDNFIPHDYYQAIYYFTLAAKQNHIESQYYLGEIYIQGTCTKKDVNKSIYYFTLAAENDLSNSQASIEIIKNNGNFISKKTNEENYTTKMKVKANAQFKLGNIYFEGKDVEKDTNKGIKYLNQAANNNHIEAIQYLGILYYEGIYVQKDIHKAMNLLLLAANQNMTDSEIILGIIYLQGVDVHQDIQNAIYFFNRAASKKDYKAMFYLADIYFSGKFPCQDFNKAFYYLSKAIEHNYAPAQYLLGQLYLNGHAVNKDIEKAINYFKLAANQNDSSAQDILGEIYYDGVYTCRDVNQAMKYYALAANQNNKDSQYRLGYIYYKNQKINEAIHYLTLASNQNHIYAQFVLGSIYAKLNNMEKAIYYYSLAAAKNCSEALHNLGILYLESRKVKRNVTKGIELLTRAAKNDYQISQTYIGYFYYFGIYIPQDINKGIHYFLKSAKGLKGQKISFIVGNIYLKGKYLNRDVDKAIHYYKESSCFNNQYAKNNLGMIYKKGFGKPKSDANSIVYFQEAIQQKNDPVAMYNLAHVYFYNEDLNIDYQTIIDLLVNSYYYNFAYAILLLQLVLLKKNKYVTPQIIEDEINKVRNDMKYLIKQLSNHIPTFNKYPIQYNIIKDMDFFYDDYLQPVTLQVFLYKKKMKKRKIKKINKYFYEGFGIDI
ncbi:hypothetical protein M9Y10_031037 [Tritrichomonas musculus]|uniref:Protein kinase domain-containing protein n=1 Tax=Tritrichomonas musculus TaxID=1915356 RepID=A0ABR2H1L8_9EUKA